MENIGIIISTLFFSFLIVTVVSMIIAFPGMWLWNVCLVAATKGSLAAVGYWQMVGIMVLLSILSGKMFNVYHSYGFKK